MEQNIYNSKSTIRPVVLITGISGLIGSAVTEALKDNYHIVGLDKKRPEKPSYIDILECDLTDFDSLENTMIKIQQKYGDQLRSVIHLAAHYDFSGQPSPLYEKLTVQGTEHLLKLLNKYFQCDQFIFSSTLLVMKPAPPGETINETSPLEGKWPYPISKIHAEEVIRDTHRNIPAVILRLAGVYTVNGNSPPITHQIDRIYKKELESYFFPGDQDRGQPFLHLDDAASAIKACIMSAENLNNYEIFLIAEPDIVTYGEMQDRIGLALHGREWPTVRIPKSLAKLGAWLTEKTSSEEEFIKPWMIDMADAHYPVSIERAEKLLNWRPKYSLRNFLPEMLAQMKNDVESWYEENELEVPKQKPASRTG